MSDSEIDPREQTIADRLAVVIPEDVTKIVVTLADGSEKEFEPTPGIQGDRDPDVKPGRDAKLAKREARKQAQSGIDEFGPDAVARNKEDSE